MSEEEFQFFKTKLKNEVKEYLEIDDQIKALNKVVKTSQNRICCTHFRIRQSILVEGQ